MKNKTKKTLAGLGLGLVGALSLTGCASDIVFNQADLDKAINGVNEYLETQNNYSSEFARNMLNDSIVKAVFKAMETNNYSIKNTQIVKDALGNIYYNTTSTNSVSYDKNTNIAKIYDIYTEGVGEQSETKAYYKEVQFVQSDDSEYGLSYKVKDYNLTDKTYTEEITGGYVNEMEFMSLQSSLNQFLLKINGSNILGDVVMNKIDENTNEFFFTTYDIEGEDSEMSGLESYSHYQFKFVGDELVYMKGALSQGDSTSYLHAIAEAYIEWNISELNVINESEFNTK